MSAIYSILLWCSAHYLVWVVLASFPRTFSSEGHPPHAVQLKWDTKRSLARLTGSPGPLVEVWCKGTRDGRLQLMSSWIAMGEEFSFRNVLQCTCEHLWIDIWKAQGLSVASAVFYRWRLSVAWSQEAGDHLSHKGISWTWSHQLHYKAHSGSETFAFFLTLAFAAP